MICYNLVSGQGFFEMSSIVEDVIAIGRELTRLERERRLVQFQLPETVTVIFQFEQVLATGLVDLQPPINICYYMNGATLLLYGIRERSETTRQTIRDFVELLQRYWPSCHLSQQNAIVFDNSEDADVFRALLNRASDV